jgi:acetyl esterase/lipase
MFWWIISRSGGFLFRAPQNTYRDVFAILQPLYEKLRAQYGADRIVFMGDSAGGGLCLALAQLLRDEGRPLPQSLILLSPWLDVTMTDSELWRVDPFDPFLSIDGLKEVGQWYAGDTNPQHHLISPLYGHLEGLPPMQVFAGSHDILVADARRLHSKSEREGFPCDYQEFAAMFHDWMLLPIPEGVAARNRLRAFITDSLNASA